GWSPTRSWTPSTPCPGRSWRASTTSGPPRPHPDPARRWAALSREPGRAAYSQLIVYEGVVQDLIDELGRLPGIGPKSAQRIAFHLLAADPEDVSRLVEALTEVKAKVRFCTVCGNVAEAELCRVCG